MEITKYHWTGIVIGLIIIIASLFFMNTKFFFLIIGVGILIAIFPFVFSIIFEMKIAAEKEDMFLEFNNAILI